MASSGVVVDEHAYEERIGKKIKTSAIGFGMDGRFRSADDANVQKWAGGPVPCLHIPPLLFGVPRSVNLQHLLVMHGWGSPIDSGHRVNVMEV